MYLAKTNGETLEFHILQCLRVLKHLKSIHPELLTELEWTLLERAVIAHDLGKINRLFQKKMRNGGKLSTKEQQSEIPHGYLSPAMIDKKAYTDEIQRSILVSSIFYHHERQEPDWEKIKTYLSGELQEEWNQVHFQSDFLRKKLRKAYRNDIDRLQDFSFSDQLRYILIKGSLNRIDYCASAGRVSVEESPLYNGKGVAQYTAKYIRSHGFELREMQSYLQAHAGENLIVTASTGSGKTEGALLWLNDKKGFYTLPLRVSINAIYERIIDINGIGYSIAHLLHSDAKGYYLTQQSQRSNESDEDNNDISLQNRYETAKLFASPLTITTIDQLLRFVYRVNGSEAAAAALATGCLIIDEIQMYSPDIIAIILCALKMITGMGGRYLIMTATFPKMLYQLFDLYRIPYQIAAKSYHGDYTKRHRIRFYEDTQLLEEIDNIVEQAQSKRVLVLCNTVKRAIEVYSELQEADCEVHLLHSRFLKRDRKRLECEILQFAPNHPNRAQQNGIWVSTQIVEASLDIDFDVLYTELCSVDSLLQRMGRVYRNRWYDLGEEANVFVFDSHNTGGGYVIDRDIYEFSKCAVRQFDGQLLEESDSCDLKEKMMDLVYDPKLNPQIREGFLRGVQQKWNVIHDLAIYQYDKENAKIRDISTETVLPESVYLELNLSGKMSEWKEVAHCCRYTEGETPEQREQRLQRLAILHEEMLSYTVDIPRNLGYYLCYTNPFQEIWRDSRVRLCKNIYDREQGLTREKEEQTAIML